MNYLIWAGAALDPSGYGEATRNYIFGLEEKGVDIKLMNRQFWKGAPVDLGQKRNIFKKLIKNNIPSEKKITIMHNLTPENYFIARDANIHACMTTFETDGLPNQWIIPIRSMDVVFTYTQFNRETFSNANINNDIRVVPHGVDVNKFRPGLSKLKSLEEATKGRFVFGSNFDWTSRKNPEALLKAYYEAFRPMDNVVLVLKVYHQFPLDESVTTIKNKIREVRSNLGFKSAKECPPVILITDMLKSEDIPSLYNSFDCFVLPTRGEGWGLPFSEAMACGVPCIATNWSGHTEYMNDKNSLLVPYKMVDVSVPDTQRQPHYRGSKWAEIDSDIFAEKMRYVYDNPCSSKLIGSVARKDMCEKWTWSMACDKLINELNKL